MQIIKMKNFVALMSITICCVSGNLLGGIYRDVPQGVGDMPSFIVQSDDAPKPCCFPDQWQGDVTFQVGLAEKRGSKFRDGKFTVFVDKTNLRVAGKGTGGRYRNETGGFIILFKSNNTAEGYFYSSSRQKCVTKQLPKAVFRPQCIPDNATYGGDFTLGPASGGLAVQAWSANEEQSRGEHGKLFVSWSAIVKPQGCIPVFIRDHGMVRFRPHHGENEIVFDEDEDMKPHPKPCPQCGKSVKFVESVYYANVEGSIKDPSVFTPPSYCKSSTDDPDIVDSFNDVVQRYVSA